MGKTKIEWCDHTINPVVGCSKCSPGCKNCYAKKMAFRLSKNPLTAKKYAGVVDEHGKWTGRVNFLLSNKDTPHRVPGYGKRVFVGSMTDIFHPSVSDEMRDDIFASILADAIIANSKNHKFIMLTKRPGRMKDYFSPGPDAMLRRWGKAGDGLLHIGDGDEFFSEYAEGLTIPQPEHEKYPLLLHDYLWPLPNLWLNVSVCNQQEADEKIPVLMQIPAAKRGVSIEPMLEPISLHPSWRYHSFFGPQNEGEWLNVVECGHSVSKYGINWVICGAETGPKKRPMSLEWAIALRNQCKDAGVPFFFKKDSKGKEFLDGEIVRQFPD